MVLFIVLGVVVLITIAVLGALFFLLSKEGQKDDEKAVPITEINQLKKELSFGLLEPQKLNTFKDDPKIIPPFEPKVTLPIQNTQSALEDNKFKMRAQELENELRTISQKAESQSDEAKQLIESLTKENETLKSQQANLEQAQQKLAELEGETVSLKTDNINLQSQLESTNGQVRLLEEQMAAVKIQMGEEISHANATVSELTREKEALLAAPKPVTDDELRKELETLKSEQIQLNKKYEDLEKENQELKYEMIKARAQSSGLERVSLNYKNQLEDFLKKIDAMQMTNDQLTQIKDRLEAMVGEVRIENEELVQKDQLAQFELEKNRSRLVSLERECEDLKARAQQQGQQ